MEHDHKEEAQDLVSSQEATTASEASNENSKTNGEDTQSNSDQVRDTNADGFAGMQSPSQKLQDELSAKEEQVSELNDKYLRLMAEMENLRRRTDKEKSDIANFGNQDLMNDLLAVLDGFDQACLSGEMENMEAKEFGSYVQGVQMVKKLLFSNLEKHGLKEIQGTGDFDPNKHQAIKRIETPQVDKDVIKEVFCKGYALNGRLLRPAMVSVEVPGEATTES